ncbi:hypothetical protein [Shewanella algae]|uniref:hypothetical protein n=1 Tax=Shewanella algae TaxID=38313 RepID=UPI0034D48F92
MSQPRTQTLLCHKEVNDDCLKSEWLFHRSRKALTTINIQYQVREMGIGVNPVTA